MGDDAAFVFAGQTGLSYRGAYDVLYGGRDGTQKPQREKFKCPICPIKFKTPIAAYNHAQEIHKKTQYQIRIANFAAHHELMKD